MYKLTLNVKMTLGSLPVSEELQLVTNHRVASVPHYFFSAPKNLPGDFTN